MRSTSSKPSAQTSVGPRAVKQWTVLGAVALFVASTANQTAAAEKIGDKPDPEMLRMMEFLKDWEMFKNMEMLREMPQVRADSKSGDATGRNTPPSKVKESVK